MAVVYCIECNKPFWEDKHTPGPLCEDCKEEILVAKGKELIEEDI